MADTKSREDVTVYEYLDGVLKFTEVWKNRTIYKNAAGVERIRYVYGYRPIVRENGKPVWHHYCKTVRALNINEFIEKVKKTGGSVVVLPSED